MKVEVEYAPKHGTRYPYFVLAEGSAVEAFRTEEEAVAYAKVLKTKPPIEKGWVREID